jgi:predicted nuclease with TOPRIM domain
MQERLEQLRIEYECGRQRWNTLEQERLELRDTMLRISGAIQVLQELLSQAEAGPPCAEAWNDAAPAA